jgi:hypothetical protein
MSVISTTTSKLSPLTAVPGSATELTPPKRQPVNTSKHAMTPTDPARDFFARFIDFHLP